VLKNLTLLKTTKIFFSFHSSIIVLINIYSDSSQLALKYLKDTKARINNVLVMAENFNIRDNLWNPNYPHHSIHSDLLFDIVDSLYLGLSEPTNHVSTRYSNNNQDSNSVLNLIFLRFGSEKLDNHSIHPKWCLVSDHAPLTITIPIFEEHIQIRKWAIIKDSDEEKNFVTELIKAFRDIDTNNLSNIDSFEDIVQLFAHTMKEIWEKNLKIVNITKQSKSWLNANCNRNLEKYRVTKHIKDWKQFKKTVKSTKWAFFDLKIQEITNKKQGLWELINWINKYKLSAIKAVKHNGYTCLKIKDLWQALYLSFNIAQNHQIDISVLDEIPNKYLMG